MLRKTVCFLTCLLTIIYLDAQIDTLYVCDPGDTIQLEVVKGAYAYTWSSATSLSNAHIYNPIAKPYVETTYIAEILTGIKNENLISNADFSEGNIGFTSDYDFKKIIISQGTYGVDYSPADLNGIYFARCSDHTDGAGKMMVVDGSPISNSNVWCQNITVEPNTNYAFSAWLASSNPANPAQLSFQVNGQQVGNVLTATTQVCEWLQFYGIWNSGETDSAEICIINKNLNPTGNDFALDDLAFYELEDIIYDTTVVIIEGLIAAKERRVYFPTAFSPNDDRENDRFEVFLGKGTEFIKEMKIFDVWGNQVFKSELCVYHEETCFWDGYVNGNPAQNGTYIYTAKILFSDKEIHQFTGSVQLIR
ncbi:T9SS type B sorting domain-containing protein [Portibacter lacus]|uniref:Gliding motility-associated C-terminal domain-containing protein n=1 Tax=Portibacter lacus TaxID=1099794 RepID=A0AA37SQ06_9BACT|nr:gliding motility-associated C-terminal domain-containing protein [Portibacter lacus]GLR18751.1 hypothetical protein GCM10007940_33670 [Portibacter lacus]